MAEELGSLAVKIGIDSSGFQTGITEVNRNLKVLDSEFKANTAALGANGKGLDGLKVKSDSLAKTMELQAQKVAVLETAYQKSVASKGKDAAATQALEIKLNGAKAALSNMGTELDACNKKIEVQSSEWTKTGTALSGAGTKLQEAGKGIKDVGGSLTKGLTLPLIAVGVGLGAMATKATDSADALQQMSDITGLSAERLQELQYIGSKVDVELDTMTGAQKFLTKAMAAAQIGTKAQVAVFKELGISATDSNGGLRDSNVVFQEAITALGKMTNPTERNAMALKLFGKSALELNPLIKTSAGEIASLTAEAHKSGAVISNENVLAMDKFSDSMAAMKLSISGAVGAAAAKLMPTLEKLLPVVQNQIVPAFAEFMQKIADLILAFSNSSPFIQKLILGFIAFAVCIGPVVVFLGNLIIVVGAIAGAFGSASVAIGAAGGMLEILTGPIGITIAVIVALIAVGVLLYKNWDTIKATAGQVWEGIKTTVGNAITGIIGFFTGLPGAIATTWTNITNGVALFFQGLQVWFMTGVQNIITTFVNGFNGLVAGLAAVWASIQAAIGLAINGIMQSLQAKFSEQIIMLRMIWMNIVLVFTQVWEIIKNVFAGALLLIIDLVTGNFTRLQTDAAAIWLNITNAFMIIWESIKLIFATAMNLITLTMTQAWNNISSFVVNTWNALVATLQGAMTAFVTFITSIWTNIVTNTTNAWNDLKASVLKLVLDTIINVKNFFNGLVTFFQTLPATLSTIGTNMFTSMKTGATNAITGLVSAVKTGIGQAITWITSLPSQAVKWGSDIINGIVTGIKNAAGAVGAAVSGVAQDIRNFLHFSLPDKGPLSDFDTYMPDMISLMVSGIDGNKGKLMSTIKGLAADMSTGINVGLSGNNMFNNPTIIGSGRKASESIGVIDELKHMIQGTVSQSNAGKSTDAGQQTIIIPVNLDGKTIAEVIYPYSDRMQGSNLKLAGRGVGA